MHLHIWLVPAVVLALVSTVHAEQRESVARVLAGNAELYEPLVGVTIKGMRLEMPLSMVGRLEAINSYPVDVNRADDSQTKLETGPAGNIQARVGLSFNSKLALLPINLGADYEHDVITGPLGGEPDIEGEGLPNSQELEHQLRKATGRVSLGYFLHVTGGLTTSFWGLGLLANDGAHGWTPGSAYFGDPRGGDRVIRVALASGPITRLGISLALGYDWVLKDDSLLNEDEAKQAIGAFTIGRNLPTTLGFYAVYRTQDSTDGDTIEIAALDMHASTTHQLPAGLRLTVSVESALILGETSLASSVDYPEKDVFQLGAALRASLDAGRFGGVLDLLYASGDSNFDDGQNNAFKPDPNYEMGLLLYRHVMAAQTGRATFTASDPELVGYPAEDLDRFPTRGSASNTVAIFPRGWWRPLKGLEVYGGPLFAFTANSNADPLNSKVAGGVPRNALDGDPGSYLGTEIDLGARFQGLISGTLLTAGIEGGVLFTSTALSDAQGSNPGPVFGGRLILAYQI